MLAGLVLNNSIVRSFNLNFRPLYFDQKLQIVFADH